MTRRPVNPVLARELRQRMRGPRAAVILTLYLGILTLIMWLVYRAEAHTSRFDAASAQNLAGLGRTLFHVLVFFVLCLVCFIVPGVTAGSVAGERARQTLVPLQVTLLRPSGILVGKLLASLAFMALLVVAVLPLAGVSFVLGGVSPGDVVKSTVMILLVTVVLGAVSLACSTFLRGTQGATVVSLLLSFALCVGTFIGYALQRAFATGGGDRPSHAVLMANPFMAMADVLDRGPDGENDSTPFTGLQSMLEERDRGDLLVSRSDGPTVVVSGTTIPFGGSGLPAPPPPNVGGAPVAVPGQRQPLLDRPPLWTEALVSWGLLTALCLWLASRRLRVPRAAAG